MRAPVLHLLLLVSPLLGSLAGCAQPQATALPAVSTTEKNVRPGINKGFLSAKLDIKKSLKKFEGESREIFAHRHRIVNHLEIAPGMTVADIGAGTPVRWRCWSTAAKSRMPSSRATTS